MSNKKILKCGQIHECDKSESGNVYLRGGVSPTIISGTHGYAIGYVVVSVRTHTENQLLSGCELLQRDNH